MRFKMNLTAFLAVWVFMAVMGYLSTPVQGRLVVACIFAWNAGWKIFSPFLCSLYLSWSSPATVNNFRLKLRTPFCAMCSFALLKMLPMTWLVYTGDFWRVTQRNFVAQKLDQVPNSFKLRRYRGDKMALKSEVVNTRGILKLQLGARQKLYRVARQKLTV